MFLEDDALISSFLNAYNSFCLLVHSLWKWCIFFTCPTPNWSKHNQKMIVWITNLHYTTLLHKNMLHIILQIVNLLGEIHSRNTKFNIKLLAKWHPFSCKFSNFYNSIKKWAWVLHHMINNMTFCQQGNQPQELKGSLW